MTRRERGMSWRMAMAMALGAVAAGLLPAGCGRPAAPGGEVTRPNPGAPAAYGPPTGVASPQIARARPAGARAGAGAADWTALPFGIVQTELSPALLVHSAEPQLDLFSASTNAGLGAPTFVAWSTMNGPRTFRRGESLDVKQMAECWVLVWWAGAEGWTNWDAPWVAYLHHRPESMKLDEDGLHLEFSGPAGDVVLLPLYGYEKLAQKGRNFAAAPGLAGPGPSLSSGRKVQTWDWPEVLKRDPLTRIRYWAAVLREFPIYCEESISVDRAKDAVTIRSRFEWHSIRDDWRTAALKLAPMSPSLGLAAKLGGFPVRFSRKWVDLDLATPYGPYLAVEGVDQFDATFSVLQYIHETERWEPAVTNGSPIVTQASKRLQEVAAGKFPLADRYQPDDAELNNFCWAIQGDSWYATALPYYDAATRSNALGALRQYFREDVLVPNRFKLREYPRGSGREYWLLEGPGIGSWGVLGDAGKFSADLLQTVWAYAQGTGDWELVKERWPLVKRLFTTAAETRWAGFGRDAMAELGDQAAPCAAFARLAYRAGDMDAYHYGCAQFARELVLQFVKQRGADYFRSHQPWHSMEYMDEEVFLTNLAGDTAGWQLDGPAYPAKTNERQFSSRWVRFKDPDVARFYREYLQEDVRRELNWLQHRWEARRRWHNDPHIMPSLVQLRSLLLNEGPAALGVLAGPDQFTGPPSGIIASCLAVLRTSHPTRYERLIPPGPPSPFVAGLEREVAGPDPHLLVSVRLDARAQGFARPFGWPQIEWPLWKTPTGAAWTFGAVRPGRTLETGAGRVRPVSWNTQMMAWDRP